MTRPQNQTRIDWIKRITKESSGQGGTGIFLVPAPEIGVLEFRKVLVPQISYHETAKRAVGCAAFKWVPADLGTHEELSALSCESISCISADDCLGVSCLCTGGKCY